MPIKEISINEHTKEKFTRLIEPLFDEIYAYSLRLTRNKQRAEDLTSDTFAKAWRYFGNFEIGTNFRAWMYSILTSIFINKFNKHKKQPGMVDYDRYDKLDEFYVYNKISNQSAKAIDDPERIISDKFSAQDVQKAVSKLPDEFKQVFMLSDLEGFSYKDIAAILKIPLGTVRSRLNRARGMLQKELWYYSEKSNEVH